MTTRKEQKEIPDLCKPWCKCKCQMVGCACQQGRQMFVPNRPMSKGDSMRVVNS